MCNRLDRTVLFARQKKGRQPSIVRMPAYLFSNNSTSLYRDPASDPESRHESVSTVQQNIRCLVFCCCHTMCSHNVKLCATGIVCELLLLARNSTTSYERPFAYLWYENNFDSTMFRLLKLLPAWPYHRDGSNVWAKCTQLWSNKRINKKRTKFLEGEADEKICLKLMTKDNRNIFRVSFYTQR